MRALGVVIGLVVLTFAIYGRTAGHGFVNFDDDQYVTANGHVLGGLSWDGVRWFATRPHSINWHPLTSLSHMLDVELFGLDAGKHHLVSAALHALASVLLFGAMRALLGSLWGAALVAALFCAHPLRVESVAWASERKDVLSGVFWMATLWAYAAYARRGGTARYLLVTLCIALGLLAKPMLVTLPLVLLLLDRWPLERRAVGPGRRLAEKLPWLVLALACGVVTLVVQARSGAVRPLQAIDLASRVSGAFVGYGLYLWKSVWPAGLAFYYPHPAIVAPERHAPWSPGALAAVLVFVAACALSLQQARRRPYAFVGWWWFVVTLLPVIGIVQVGEQAWADRYAYLPLVGIHLALAAGLRELVGRRPRLAPWTAGACLAALAALSVVSARQVRVWKDSVTLCERALAVTRDNALAHNNLGLAYLERGRVADARRSFEAALRILPHDRKARLNLAIAAASEGDLERARGELEALVAAHPRMAEAHANLGSLLAREGRLDEARARLEQAIALDPSAPGPHANLGLVHLRSGALDAAAAAIDRALARHPLHVAAWRASNELAWRRATSPRDAERDAARALARARRGAAAGVLEPSAALTTLAAAEAAGGDFRAAVASESRALELAPPGAKEEHRARLELYRAGRPYRSAP